MSELSINCLDIKRVIAIVIILISCKSFSQLKAFPEAEGNGELTVGGRFGKIIEVTNLNDNGPGSLRAAITTRGARIIVFRVSGTITLNSKLKISYDSVTIAGQTAPGDGICIRKYPLDISANHVILRYLRFRLGDENPTGEDDALSAFSGKKYIIIDHCSVSWSIDEAMSCYANENFTAQWNLISESLYSNHHSKGPHGYGGIWGGKNATFHHNLFAHHTSRNPRFAGGETQTCQNVDFRNNVIYNWGFNSVYGGEAGTINMVGNYYKSGPATKSGVKNRIVQIADSLGRWYIDSNYVEGYPLISENNWSGGVQGPYINNSGLRIYQPNPYVPVNMDSPQELLQKIYSHVGASLPKRDAIDSRIINEVRNGTATFYSKSYAKLNGLDTNLVTGIIDTQTVVGGWVQLNSITPPSDSDHDGMPDDWEISHGLNPNDSTDRNNIHSSGYSYIEVYLNELGTFPNSIKEYEPLQPDKMVLIQNYPNPFNPSTNIEFNLDQKCFATLKIYDILGKEKITLVEGEFSSGIHTVKFDAKNLSAGIYFAIIKAGQNFGKVKLILLK